MSTGLRTEAGRRRISKTQAARWAAWRAARGKTRLDDDERLRAAAARAAGVEHERAPELEDLYAEDLGTS